MYGALLVAVGTLFAFSLEIVRVRGGFAFPAWFGLFRVLFFVQFGFFGAATLSLILYLSPRLRLPVVVRGLVLAMFYSWCAWLCAWGLTQSAYGIELTPRTIVEFFTNPVAFGAMGLETREFVSIAVGVVLFVGILTAASLAITSRTRILTRGRFCLAFVILFLAFHLPVRTYFVHHINRGSHVVLAYDDSAPLSLASERLIPGLRADRPALPNLEDERAAKAYFEFVRTMRMPLIPRPHNILWIVVESWRFDAINERAMPRLFALRDQFQIRLERNHWSGGNATQFGIYSMLVGLSGAHFRAGLRAKANAPFLRLLAENNYRLRVANNSYMQYGGLFRLLPSATVCARFNSRPRDEGDRRMIDLYLDDRRGRAEQPTFDFLTFDATHWPYFYPETHRRFQPAELVSSSRHVLRSEIDLEAIRNRYDNACGFVDDQIARVLEELKARGGFENTIVVIVGDHGEEFQERGQITHSAALNDYQGRTPLWIHLPEAESASPDPSNPTVHMDIVPTLLQALGFAEDLLFTQGRSLLGPIETRRALSLCEQGFTVPLYRAVVTNTYISRWWRTPRDFLFSGVQRRDGGHVEGVDWLREAREVTPEAALTYERLPEITQPARPFLAR